LRPGAPATDNPGRSRVLARFDLGEAARPEAAGAVADLRRLGVEVAVLSGDRPAAVARLAESLAIPAEGGLLPDDKLARMTADQDLGEGVAMVGDGINDVPILAAADVGIAVGSASGLARRSGNVRLLGDRLDRVPELLRIARDVRRRIRANLLWAFGFNSVGIVLAAIGSLTPVFAAAAKVLSSLTVVRISSGAGLLTARLGLGVSGPALEDLAQAASHRGILA
jgi:P-type E1-E2 ATPase